MHKKQDLNNLLTFGSLIMQGSILQEVGNANQTLNDINQNIQNMNAKPQEINVYVKK